MSQTTALDDKIGWRYIKDWGQPEPGRSFLHVFYNETKGTETGLYYQNGYQGNGKLRQDEASRYLYVDELDRLTPPKRFKYPWSPMEDLNRNCGARILIMGKNGRIEKAVAYDTWTADDEKYGRIAWCAEENLIETVYE